MTFKLDENLPGDLALLLREHGHDVTDVTEEKLSGKSDDTVLEAAAEEGRILLTLDLDFADIRRYPLESHCGILVFRLEDQRWENLRATVDRLLADKAFEKLNNCLGIADEVRIRFRRPRSK